MVLLDVELDVGEEIVALQEGVAGGDVEIVLVLGRLLGLGFDQERPLETDLVLVLDHQRDKAAELVEFAPQVGVEQGLVALAPAPEHVVLAAEPMRHLERRPDLPGSVGEDLRIRIGRRTCHVAAVREQVGRPPQQAHLGRGHLAFEQIGDRVEIGDGLGKRPAFRRDVGVMKGEERHIEQAEQLEGDVGLGAGEIHRIGAMLPGPQEGLAAERIAAGPAERMPVADGEPQLILQPPAADHAIPVVPSERQRCGRVPAAISDRSFCFEEIRCCVHV